MDVDVYCEHILINLRHVNKSNKNLVGMSFERLRVI